MQRSTLQFIVAAGTFTFFTSALVPPAYAEPSVSDARLAEALFRDGKKLMAKKDYENACPKFEESFRLVAKLGVLLNLATCHEDQGKTGSAFGEYTRAASLAKDTGEKKRLDYARERLRKLEARLSKVVLEVEELPVGADVMIDEQSIGRPGWGTPIPVDPGTHLITATAPGYAKWQESVDVPVGPNTLPITIPRLEADGSPEPSPATPPVNDAAGGGVDGLMVGGVVLLAVGAIGVGVGTYFGIDTFNKNDESEPFCTGNQCTAQGVELRDDAFTSATISTIAIGAGAAAGVAGIVMLALSGGDETEVGIAPVIAPGYGGAYATWSF